MPRHLALWSTHLPNAEIVQSLNTPKLNRVELHESYPTRVKSICASCPNVTLLDLPVRNSYVSPDYQPLISFSVPRDLECWVTFAPTPLATPPLRQRPGSTYVDAGRGSTNLRFCQLPQSRQQQQMEPRLPWIWLPTNVNKGGETNFGHLGVNCPLESLLSMAQWLLLNSVSVQRVDFIAPALWLDRLQFVSRHFQSTVDTN